MLVLVLVGGVRAGSDGGAVGGSVHFAAAAANDGFDDDWCLSQEAENAMKEAEARLHPGTAAAPDTDDDGDLAAAASRALGIGCVDDADDDDASLAAEKLHDCAQDFVTQESTSALEQEIDLPEDEDYGTDYSLTYESASTMIAQSLDTATAPTDELMSEAAWRAAWASRKPPPARRARHGARRPSPHARPCAGVAMRWRRKCARARARWRAWSQARKRPRLRAERRFSTAAAAAPSPDRAA